LVVARGGPRPRDEFPGIEIRLSSDYSPVLEKVDGAQALMRLSSGRRADGRFELHARCATDPLVFVFPSDHRLASQAAIAPQEIANENFCLPSKSASCRAPRRSGVFQRAGIDLKPEHEVHNVVHAI